MDKYENFSSLRIIEQDISSNDDFNQCELRSAIEMTDSVSTHEIDSPTFTKYTEEHSISTVSEKTFDTLNILTEDYVSNVSTNTNDNEISVMGVPKLWSITKLTIQEQQRILFSHFVIRRVNGIEIPIVQKSVMINTDNKLSYFVYERIIDPQSFDLTPLLQDSVQLTLILEKFKNMNICSGLGAVNIYYLTVNSAFKDSIEQWRDNKCTMISKWKRCDYCIKMRLRIMQKEARSKKTFYRIRQVETIL